MKIARPLGEPRWTTRPFAARSEQLVFRAVRPHPGCELCYWHWAASLGFQLEIFVSHLDRWLHSALRGDRLHRAPPTSVPSDRRYLRAAFPLPAVGSSKQTQQERETSSKHNPKHGESSESALGTTGRAKEHKLL